MPKEFKGSSAVTLLAIKPGDVDSPAFKAAIQICRRTGMALRLVSVVETDSLSGVQCSPYDEYDFTAIGSEPADDARLAVEDDLRRIATQIDLGTPVATSVIVGKPTEAILAESTLSNAALVVVGTTIQRNRPLLRGLSTALSVTAHSSRPLMIVGRDAHVDFGKDRLDILLADSLASDSERAALVAHDLAIALRTTNIRHVYVQRLGEATFERLGLGTRSSLDHAAPQESPWSAHQRSLQERMMQRVSTRRPFLEEAGGRVTYEIRSGSPEAELEKAVESHPADLVVFGRHHWPHFRPFPVGRIALDFLVSRRLPVLIVPAT